MKRMKFYVCPECGNIFTAASAAEISCCGRKLSTLEANAPDEGHTPETEIIDDEFYVTFPHEMKKSHYISFAAVTGCDRVYLQRLYPEQDAAARLPVLLLLRTRSYENKALRGRPICSLRVFTFMCRSAKGSVCTATFTPRRICFAQTIMSARSY